jgi:hypothetical protein
MLRMYGVMKLKILAKKKIKGYIHWKKNELMELLNDHMTDHDFPIR